MMPDTDDVTPIMEAADWTPARWKSSREKTTE
jgi:hypothetical protein